MSQAGKKIGAFNVLAEIGAGGMAVIYKAEQPALGRLVAIKELRKELATDASIITRFEREAKSVAALAHQNIVHIYDFVNRGDSMFIAMEYVRGHHLYDLMNRVDRVPPTSLRSSPCRPHALWSMPITAAWYTAISSRRTS